VTLQQNAEQDQGTAQSQGLTKLALQNTNQHTISHTTPKMVLCRKHYEHCKANPIVTPTGSYHNGHGNEVVVDFDKLNNHNDILMFLKEHNQDLRFPDKV
jgi:hypothetical protein